MEKDSAFPDPGIMNERKEEKKRVFFWKNKVGIILKITEKSLSKIVSKASLQTWQKIPEIYAKTLKPRVRNKRNFKRTLFFSSPLTEASMCVEAALSFSFFFFFMINIYSILFLFINYTKELEDLQQRAKREAAYTFYREENPEEEELIRYEKKMKFSSFVGIIGGFGGIVPVQCVIKPWTGYGRLEDQGRDEEEIVYITEYGEVYHRDRACTHLSLSVQMISYEKMRKKGKNFQPCELCLDKKQNGFITFVYITDYGERYHRSAGCRSLKRTIQSLPFSKVEGKAACLKCRE